MHEIEALIRLKRGDIAGLEVITRLYAARAVRAAYLVTRDAALAEDVAQDAFIQAYSRIAQYDVTRPFAPWFLRIVINRAIDAAKRQRRNRAGTEDALDLADRLPDTDPGLISLAEQAELRADVWQALGRLSPKQRAVVVTRYYLKLSEEEMANRLAVLTGPHGYIIRRPGSAYAAGTQGGTASWLLWFPGAGAQTARTVNLHLRQGPFAFSIPATVGHSRLFSPRESATADGWTITLERVMLTPSSAVFTLRGAGPDARVQLTAGGKTYPLYAGGFTGTAAIKECFAEHRRCPNLWKNRDIEYSATAVDSAGSDGRGLEVNTDRTAQWLEELNAAHGTWSITITPDLSHTNPVFRLKGGPWSFHFTV